MAIKLKKGILIFGDICILYVSLFITLGIRYGVNNLSSSLQTHIKPFSTIFIVWILLFYLADLYDIRLLKKEVQLLKNLVGAVSLATALSIIFFYLFSGFFELTPKTNLALFALVFGVINFAWRWLVVKSNYAKMKVLILGESIATAEILSYLTSNPHVGYDPLTWQTHNIKGRDYEQLERIVKEQKIDIISIPSRFIKEDLPIVKLLYRLLPLKVKIVNSLDLYESLFEKVPLEDLEEGWFVERITTRRKVYDFVKRVIDIVFSLVFGIILFPLMLLVALLTALSPRKGPVVFKQQRAGTNGAPFTLYKFGIMKEDAGALWTLPKDERLTQLGTFLNYTRLNELPQLWNIFVGDISFIGPRAESMDLVKQYASLPYYDIRHIIKPGLTGWAQIKYKPSASKEEAFEKLKYDIYYIKNRSFILDFLIIIRTIRTLVSKPG